MAPGLGLLLGALVVPFLPSLLRRMWTPAVGLMAILAVASLTPDSHQTAVFWGYELHLLRVDTIRLVFGWAFAIAIFLWGIYAWDNDDRVERSAGLAYAGCAMLVVFSGDWLVFFLGWEGMALASTVVVLAGRTASAWDAALRYLIVHILSGILVLTGLVLVHAHTGSWSIEPLGAEAFSNLGLGPILLFLGFAINAAVWPLGAWLPDAYPEASPTGTILLATFTTKTSVFAFTMVFAGTTALLVLGALMALYGMIYALSTRDYRKLLAYSLIGQVGFMLCAVGAGPAPGPDGFTLGQSAAAAHALMHVLYKSLLFMTAGVVLLRTGRREGGGFGGLWRQLPFTFGAALVGAAAISAVPLTNGFASKSLILDAVHHGQGRAAAFAQIALYLASAAAPLYVGLRYPWLAFSGKDEGVKVSAPATLPMRLGMGITALLCLALGLVPGIWLRYLPGVEGVHIFSLAHVGKQLALLAAGVVAFVLWRWIAAGVIWDRPGTLPDSDVLWRRGAQGFVAWVEGPFERAMAGMSRFFHEAVPEQLAWVAQNPAGFVRVALERVRLGLTALVGSASMIDRAQARFAEQLDLYRQTRAASAWPIGRTVLFVFLIFTLALVIWLFR